MKRSGTLEQLIKLGILGGLLLGMKQAGITVPFIGDFPIGTPVEYIPRGLTRWSDARVGTTSSAKYSGTNVSPDFLPTNISYYDIAGYGFVQSLYVRKITYPA